MRPISFKRTSRRARGQARLALKAAGLALAGMTLAGCSKFEQVQYFEVVGPADPITGLTSRSYYRMTVTGRGMGVEEYKMRAAYLSSAALDTLDGKIPTIPAADMDEDRREYFKMIRTAYLETAQSRAEELAARYDGGAMDPQQFDQVMTEISRAVWAVTLSDSDLASLGQVRSVDPFEFRKLVFYASARAVALDRYNAQVDSAIQKTNALANLFDRSRGRDTATASTEIMDVAKLINTLGKEVIELQTSVEEAHAAHAAAEQQHADLNDQHADLTTETKSIEEQIGQLENKITTLEAIQPRVQEVTEEIAHLRVVVGDLSRRHETLVEIQDALGQQVAVALEVRDQKKTELDALNAALELAQTRLQGQIDALQALVDATQSVDDDDTTDDTTDNNGYDNAGGDGAGPDPGNEPG